MSIAIQGCNIMSNFHYCLNASTIKTTPILKKISVAGHAGYEAIELWHDDIDAYLAEGGTLADLRKALDDHNLVVPTTIYLAGWFDAAGQEYAQAIDECKRKLDQAVELGASYAIAAPPLGQADYDLGARHYHDLLQIGIEKGVKPSMEFLGFVEQLSTIEDALEIMNKSGHPQATMILDPFHVFRGGGSIESIARLREGQIAISHFNDAPAFPPREQQHDPDRVMPGDGHLDLKSYLQLLNDIGYRRYLSLELFREELWVQDPLDVARTGLEKMRAVVEG